MNYEEFAAEYHRLTGGMNTMKKPRGPADLSSIYWKKMAEMSSQIATLFQAVKPEWVERVENEG